VYVEADYLERGIYQIGGLFASALKDEPWRRLLKSQAALWSAPDSRPDPERRRTIVAEAEDEYRRTLSSRLTTADGYDFTADAALAVITRVLSSDAAAGFKTPAGQYGADLVFECGRVERTDAPLR
jgi:short subunit dehydrogenase-like uncharacterized protein